MKKVVVITGPTSIGKTALSIDVVKHFGGEVINCDASQFKKGLDIGTAKITESEKNGVIHHLIDNASIDQDYTVKEYQEDCRGLIDEITSRGKIPFLVGGSGLYISASLYDYHFNETPTIDESQYDNYSNEELHKILEDVDYQSSLTIHQNNRRRVIRAIELSKTSQKISQNKEGSLPLYDILIICLTCPRELLYERINKRFDVMVENGWIDECKTLVEKGIDLSSIKDIGYKEIGEYLNGFISYEEMSEIVKQKTRNYAKRQMTWFRNKLNCQFVEMNYEDISCTKEEIINLIDKFI